MPAAPNSTPARSSPGYRTWEYAEDIKDFQGDWKKLKTPEERIKAIIKIVNDQLKAANVYPVGYEFTDTGANEAEFSYREWEVEIGKKKFEGATISDEQMKALGGIIYHECRHAEQFFRIAQMLAGKGRTARQIKEAMFIDADAIAAALAKPIAPGTMEAVIAQGWFDSIYGQDRPTREKVFNELKAATKAYNKAVKDQQANPTPANKAEFKKADARYKKAFAAYKNLPEETDAFRVQGEAQDMIAAELAD